MMSSAGSSSQSAAVPLATKRDKCSFSFRTRYDKTSCELPAFQYEPLDRDKNEIRLLRILPRRVVKQPHLPEASRGIGQRLGLDSCDVFTETELPISLEIFHVNLDDQPVYKALSYTWGSPSDGHYIIHVNKAPFRVQKNLWLALDRFTRIDAPLVIWIDAICIDQVNDLERNHQVKNMKMIYEQADEVLVWLGEEIPDIGFAFQFVRDIHECGDNEEQMRDIISKTDVKSCLPALVLLLKSDYWWRIWIVQELTVANKVALLCGDYTADGTKFIEFQGRCGSHQLLAGTLVDIFPADVRSRSSLVLQGLGQIEMWKGSLASANLSFFECLLHHYYRQSTDERDMIYGIASLANQTSTYKIQVDYSLSAAEVYTHFARIEILSSGKLNILTRASLTSSDYVVPSWVPDWGGKPIGHLNLRNPTEPELYFSAALNTDAVTQFKMRGDGLCIGALLIGYVDVVGAPANMQDWDDIDTFLLTFLAWWALVKQMELPSSEVQVCFGRTLSVDQARGPGISALEVTNQYLHILGGFSDLVAKQYPHLHVDKELRELWDDYIATYRDHTSLQGMRNIMRAWLTGHYCWDRQFFISGNKTMGLAPKGTRQGDIICVPLGCYHPLILRKVGDHYINLGEAYVDGYMFGNAIEMMEAGELEVQTFEIH